jgi:hypothetical protein
MNVGGPDVEPPIGTPLNLGAWAVPFAGQVGRRR